MITDKTLRKIEKPIPGEYPPYAIKYIDQLPDDGMVLQHLKNNISKLKDFIFSLPAGQLNSPIEKGKWTIKEILIHVTDVERIFSYRALCIARNDKTILPGMEQDAYVLNSRASERSLYDIFEEYEALRYSTICLFNSFDEEALNRKGNTAGNEITARALVYMAAGHELHHINYIKNSVSR